MRIYNSFSKFVKWRNQPLSFATHKTLPNLY